MRPGRRQPVVTIHIEQLRIFRTIFWVSLRENSEITGSPAANLPQVCGVNWHPGAVALWYLGCLRQRSVSHWCQGAGVWWGAAAETELVPLTELVAL